jgi:hypothetical protein
MFFLVFVLYFMTRQKTKKLQKELINRPSFIKPVIVEATIIGCR